MRPITSITVHCSDTETGTVEAIRKYHVETKGWRDIGYHFVIYRDGSLHTGRPMYMSGAHCPETNMSGIGICVIGKKAFEKKQLEMLEFVVKDLQSRFSIKEVRGHCDYPSAKRQKKSCPSPQIETFLKEKGLWK